MNKDLQQQEMQQTQTDNVIKNDETTQKVLTKQELRQAKKEQKKKEREAKIIAQAKKEQEEIIDWGYNAESESAKMPEDSEVFKLSKGKLLWRMIVHAKPIFGWLILSAIIMLLSVGLALWAPKVLEVLTDTIFDYDAGTITAFNWTKMLSDSLLLIGIYVVSALASTLNMLIMNNVVSRFYTCGIRIKISDKIRRLPVSFVDKTPVGEIMSRMSNDVSRMGNTIHNVLYLVIQGGFQLVGITVMMFLIDWRMALVVVGLIPISLILSSVLVAKSEKFYGQERKLWGKQSAFIEEDYTGFDTIKAFNLENSQNKIQADCGEQMKKYSIQGQIISGRVQSIVQFINNISFVAICVLGGYLAITVPNEISVGSVVAIIYYSKLFSQPLESIAQGFSMLQRAFASARRVFDLLDKEEMDTTDQEVKPAGLGNIVFENVSFSYDPAHPLIEDLNVSVTAGQKVAIVGPTGGGKTTIVNLLMRFYDVNSGRILIDGVDTQSISRESVRDLFAMVLQDTWLYSGTIYDNIAYGRPSATEQEVKEAAQHAHIDKFIESLPQGYETLINEESTNISGGQKQLLTIARAYLSNKTMLILDEATSNVDTRTELLIQKAMDELTEKKTSFVIAHRLSTIVNADVILVVNNGKIVEKGTHASLMAQNGFYSEIYNSQYDLLT